MQEAWTPETLSQHATSLKHLCDIVSGTEESVISYADYAVAMVDEAFNGNHIQQRISVVAK